MTNELERAMQHFAVEYHIFRNGEISSDQVEFYRGLSQYLAECLEALYLDKY